MITWSYRSVLLWWPLQADFYWVSNNFLAVRKYRCSHLKVFLEKSVLKTCSKFTGEHPYLSVISIKLLCNFIEIILRHGCSPVNLLYLLRTRFTKNTSGWLLLKVLVWQIIFFLILLLKTHNPAAGGSQNFKGIGVQTRKKGTIQT